MSAYEPASQDSNAVLTDFDARPDDCDCWNTDAALPCFACYLAGHEEPNPAAGEGVDDV